MTVKSADRTIEVLEVLARSTTSLSLADLHEELGYPKSSLYTLLQTLVARRWVETDMRGGLYRIGVGALLAGTSYLDRDPVARVAAPVLEEVRTEVNETVHLARLDGASIVYLASRESQHHLRTVSRVGRRLPAYATALGRAILANRPDGADLVPKHPEVLSPKGIADRDTILAELELASARGYSAESEQTNPGLGCRAVVLGYNDPVTDALSCSVPLARLDEQHGEKIVNTLLDASRRITDLLMR
ncbi:DNA-binding IclR family transcriptional regulator [Lipingzhangella halophila]|uniref:Glycerol operon regulatory protein n=1 Tax=Lipingzhangella halophila TaxID=1783352 RepID=A0A7W7W608_9ACTN|nr:IclR family transcriptional regulator [Lipingzhangella halophila]MBB4935236.1 DNA-binding IclR family transcriptional regulator [Lipingzhangella halophila]